MRPVSVREHKGMLGMRRALEGCDFLAEEIDRYTLDQMREVYLGVMAYFTEDKLRMYKSPRFTGAQMHEIRMGFMNDLSVGQVACYANPAVPWQAMRLMRVAMRDEGLRRDLELAESVEEGLLAAVDEGIVRKGNLKLKHRVRHVNID